jgi:hypothetical protein
MNTSVNPQALLNLQLVHNLVPGDLSITIFLEPIRYRIQSTVKDFRWVRFDLTLAQPFGERCEEFCTEFMICFVRLSQSQWYRHFHRRNYVPANKNFRIDGPSEMLSRQVHP